MDAYSTTKQNIIENSKNKWFSTYIPINVVIDDEFIKKLCEEYKIQNRREIKICMKVVR